MNDNKFELSTAVETKPGNNHQSDLVAILQEKYESLIKNLNQTNEQISQVQGEFNRQLTQLQAKKKTDEEKLQHIEALLNLEGCLINDNQSASNVRIIPVATDTISVTDTAYHLLEEIKQPLHYKEMSRMLQDRKVYIPGQDPAATLLSKITRDKRFKRTKKRGTYTLTSWHNNTPVPKSRRVKRKRKSK